MGSTKYKIIIAGSRTFTDYTKMRTEALRAIREAFNKIDKNDVTIISGGARGADALGERFAKEFNLNCHIINADWDKYGKRAGYLRNEQMAEFARTVDDGYNNVNSMLIAFWDGTSPGTKHMIEIAKNKKMNVVVVRY